jgi:predicted CXXCH cytochrome family protein
MTRPGKIRYGLMVAAGALLLAGCSTYTGKSLIHLFFDGVPEADTTLAARLEGDGMQPDSSGYQEEMMATAGPGNFFHYPYGERDCGACHDQQSLGNLVEPQPGLCYTCHEDLSTRYHYLHGPVAGGYCTACHDPHTSRNNMFLRLTGDELCFHCHKREGVLRNEVHEGLDGMLCTECHNPHGGEDHFIFQ